MKIHIIFLLSALTLLSCHSLINEPIGVCKNNEYKDGNYITLDTLILDERVKDSVIRIKPINISFNNDKIILRQVLYNNTNDTLNIKMTSSAGWSYPEFNPVILPKAYSENLYHLTTKEQHGNVRTNFYLFYSKRNVVKEKQYRISTVINLIFSK